MKNEHTDKWLLALHEIARTINTPRTDNHTDGECLDAVWVQLVNLGINPDVYNSAPDAIAPRALSVSESPTLTASAVAPLRSAVTAFNNCEGGKPLGFAVFCSDMSGQWVESGFTDEAGAERFAEHFTMYDSDHSASVGLLITDDRSLWDDVENRGGAHCVIVWNDTSEEVAVFISFEPSDEDDPRDESTFYYATHEEWEDLAQGNDHHDGWYIQEITNYTTKETTK